MITAVGNITVPGSIITVMMPIAVYFLILGLLNSRKAPQLLTGPEDSLLLVGSVGLLAVPALAGGLGAAGLGVAAGLVAVGVVAYLALVRPRAWVIYNFPAADADKLIEGVLEAMGRSFTHDGRQFILSDGARIEVSCFSLLRSVSIRLHGSDARVRQQFGELLAKATETVSAETGPAAMALLLVAMGMLIAPLTFAAHKAGEIVRLISDLLQ